MLKILNIICVEYVERFKVFVETLIRFFQDSLVNRKHLFEIEIFCNIFNVFTVNFEQFNEFN